MLRYCRKMRWMPFFVSYNPARMDVTITQISQVNPALDDEARIVGICGQMLDAGLELNSSSDRFDRARKLRQEPVAETR